ncbi:Mu-like prophage FluMu protein gp29 [Bienertia sinuspersici]
MVPTLWLPISSTFLGLNIANLLSLVGLDCIFNLGATLFLLMANSTTQPKDPTQSPRSKAVFSYQFWNMFASLIGYPIPLALFLGSQKGFLQPQLTPISCFVLLGPYLLLLSVQILTELLTWHWQSPVWLVTPVVYKAYRVLQLMRGLKLSAEISVPAWIMHTIRGLVCWWILILGLQLMRVAWFAGFSAKTRQEQKSYL